MKSVFTRCFAVILALAFVVTALCCCASPLSVREIDAKQNVFFTIYVCGAVENEGFYKFKEGTSYFEIIEAAGVLPVTYMPDNASAVADKTLRELVVSYIENGKRSYPVNVNGVLPKDRLGLYGIGTEVYEAVTSYKNLYGKISDKKVLKKILGADYESNHYRFYVSVQDYEARN